MKALKISKDVVTLAEFKSQAASLLERIGSSSQPLLITQNGKPAGVLLSPAEFDRIQEQESSRFVTSVNRGLQDADSGKVLTSTQVKTRLGIKNK
jgi:prevent-host-death family protein